jgi:hypothetical protein
VGANYITVAFTAVGITPSELRKIRDIREIVGANIYKKWYIPLHGKLKSGINLRNRRRVFLHAYQQ